MNVLSLFNGYGGCILALQELNIKVDKYYSSEIDKFANIAANALNPSTIQLGDITKWREWNIDFSNVGLVGAGSPCEGFSAAGKKGGTNAILDGVEILVSTRKEYLEAKKNGAEFLSQSYLLWEFVLLLDHVKSLNPFVKFMLENVKMKDDQTKLITDAIGIDPILINSRLVSPQNRVRNYWSNSSCTHQPDDTNKKLIDVLDLTLPDCNVGIAVREKSKTIRVGGRNSPFGSKHEWDSPFQRVTKKGKVKPGIEKSACLTGGANSGGNHSDMDIIHTEFSTRRYTTRECARLQGIPENKIDILLNCGISNSQIFKMLGNGWQLDTIKHIFKGLLCN